MDDRNGLHPSADARGAVAEVLDPWMKRETPRVDEALQRVLRWVAEGGSGGALGPDEIEAIGHGLLGGGKRLRPLLCVAAWRACAEVADDAATPDAVHDIAASLEMIHAYSLMHDDLPCMDDAELRRGQPTTHRVHGEVATMYAGAALIPAAALRARSGCRTLGCSEEATRAVASELLVAAGGSGMVGGQWVDLLGEGMALQADDLDALHRMKTGALLTAALGMGALAAGVDAGRAEALRRYGRAIGLAFQIADDVLDATADAETLGKNPSDTDLDKSTYVSLYGLDEARARATAQIDGAIEALHAVSLDAPILEAIARYVVERER